MIEAQFQAFNERLVIFRNPSRSWGTISSRWCAPTRIDRNGTRSITVSLLPVSFANPCIRLTFYKSTVDNEQFTYQRRSFDPDLQVVPCFDWPWSIFIDETTRFATRTRRRGRESPVVSMMITQACLVLVKRWRLHGPNRSTGLGQLTAGQSRGTRRHAALTADPREPIASTRLSTLSLTRDSQPLPPCAPYDLPRLTGTSWELDESRAPLPSSAPTDTCHCRIERTGIFRGYWNRDIGEYWNSVAFLWQHFFGLFSFPFNWLTERTGSRWIVEVGGERNENVCLICLSSLLNTETVISDEFRAMLRSSGKISPGFFRFHLIDWRDR